MKINIINTSNILNTFFSFYKIEQQESTIEVKSGVERQLARTTCQQGLHSYPKPINEDFPLEGFIRKQLLVSKNQTQGIWDEEEELIFTLYQMAMRRATKSNDNTQAEDVGRSDDDVKDSQSASGSTKK